MKVKCVFFIMLNARFHYSLFSENPVTKFESNMACSDFIDQQPQPLKEALKEAVKYLTATYGFKELESVTTILDKLIEYMRACIH